MDQWLIPAAVAFLLLGSATALFAGVALLVRREAAFRLFAVMNRWVSTRKALKFADQVHDIDAPLHRNKTVLGAAILLCAGVSLWLLLRAFDADAILDACGARCRSVFAEMALRATKSFLVVGHLAAIAVGVTAAFFPAALGRIEARANAWHSLRKHGQALDRMRMGLDDWVMEYPRAFGACIVIGALIVLATLGGAVLGRA